MQRVGLWIFSMLHSLLVILLNLKNNLVGLPHNIADLLKRKHYRVILLNSIDNVLSRETALPHMLNSLLLSGLAVLLQVPFPGE